MPHLLAVRHFRLRWIALAALAEVLSFPSKTLAQSDLLQVPILWCVLKGTDLASVSDGERNQALWRLHALASDRVFIPRADVTLRSELVWNLGTSALLLQEQGTIKIIDDPNPATGLEGDIGNEEELQYAEADCRKAYESDRLARSVALQGIVALYVRRMSYIRGSDTSADSFYGAGYNGVATGNQCSNPSTVTKWVNAYLGVEETVRNALGGADRAVARTFLAHEFGHTLSLRHGNGADDFINSDNRIDEDGLGGCGSEEQETVCNQRSTIMNASASSCLEDEEIDQATTFMSREQIAQLRRVANAVPGRWPSGVVDLKNPVASDYRSDSRGDMPFQLRRLDLVGQIVAHDADDSTTSFIHRLNGSLAGLSGSELLGSSYVVFADLDDSLDSGGNPADLPGHAGFDTDFTGAELVAEVRFEAAGPVANVWKFEEDSFAVVSDPRITTSVQSAVDGETGVAAFDSVSLAIPDDIVGPLATPIRLQAMATDPTGMTDRLPDDRGSSVAVWLVPARYPECSVSPDPVTQGQETTVTASFPLGGAPVQVLLGDEPVAEGMTDGAGEVEVPFAIPPDAQAGRRLVSLRLGDSALTADCSVVVNSPPDCSEAVASRPVLWPPNHRFADVSVQSVTDPDGDPLTIDVTGIRQDEPLTGGGSGDTCPDGKVVDASTARLRAERAGNPLTPGDGRVYHVGFVAADSRGGTCSGSATVCVPHDDRAPTCVDGGALFDSTAPCDRR